MKSIEIVFHPKNAFFYRREKNRLQASMCRKSAGGWALSGGGGLLKTSCVSLSRASLSAFGLVSGASLKNWDTEGREGSFSCRPAFFQ